MQNPEIIKYNDDKYAIRFTRKNWEVLMWVQDLTGKKLKSNIVDLPIVLFLSRKDAETEVLDVIIPYLLKEKAVDSVEICGWS